jgi:hypothetical protein
MRRCLAMTVLLAAAQAAGKYGWHGSWQTARDEARRLGKPLFVVLRCEP